MRRHAQPASEMLLENQEIIYRTNLAISGHKAVKALIKLYVEGPLKPSELGLNRHEINELVGMGLCNRSRYVEITPRGAIFLERYRKAALLKTLRREVSATSLLDLLNGHTLPDPDLSKALEIAGLMMKDRGHRELKYTHLTRNDIRLLRDVGKGLQPAESLPTRLLKTGLIDRLPGSEYYKLTRLGMDFLECFNNAERLIKTARKKKGKLEQKGGEEQGGRVDDI
jgi:predicted transcriptional regulator